MKPHIKVMDARGDIRSYNMPLLDEAAERNLQAVSLHLEGRLREARRLYAEVLKLDPPREPTPQEVERVERHAPLLYTVPTEPLPLRDVVAVIHPDEPIIGYHLFYEDDIDFPDDDEPSDHEIVWAVWNRATNVLAALYTWYHGYLLSSASAVVKANRAGARPVVQVQWGKHGSLLDGWKEIRVGGISVLEDMRRTYERLHTEGRRLVSYPAARHWPPRFDGTWDEFTDFSCRVDALSWLRRKRMIVVSRWANAVINQLFLLYNFHPKWEWPPTV